MTKPKILTEIAALCSAALLVTLAGCLNTDQREDIRDTVHAAILEYVEKLREVMGEIEKEDADNE